MSIVSFARSPSLSAASRGSSASPVPVTIHPDLPSGTVPEVGFESATDSQAPLGRTSHRVAAASVAFLSGIEETLCGNQLFSDI